MHRGEFGSRISARSLARPAAVAVAVIAMIGACLTGTAAAQSGHPAYGGISSASTPSAATKSKECFYSFPSCSSIDPNVTFSHHSVGDTSACSFKETVDWGDKSSTTKSFSGGPNGKAVVTFDHTYTGKPPHEYKIIDTVTEPSGNCGIFGTATRYFTLVKVEGKAHFAALGDSYSSGNGTPRAEGQCSRSPQAWPELVPEVVGGTAISHSVVLLACSGADSNGSETAPVEDLPAQIARLRHVEPVPGIVTVTIGGDDGRSVGVGFRNVLTECVKSHNACVSAVKTENAWIAFKEPKLLRQDYSAIKAADPSALILAVGYPRIFSSGRCTPFSAADVELLNDTTNRLDAEIADAAAAVPGVVYVDASSAFSPDHENHELCSADPWIIPPLKVNAHIGVHDWIHPNKAGQQSIARIVANFVKNRL